MSKKTTRNAFDDESNVRTAHNHFASRSLTQAWSCGAGHEEHNASEAKIKKENPNRDAGLLGNHNDNLCINLDSE